MRSYRRFLAIASLLPTTFIACDRSSPTPELLGKSADAVVSDQFDIACEAGSAPGVAVNGSLALAAWIASDGTTHAARFHADGTVIDGTPISLGIPSSLTMYPQNISAPTVLVTPTSTGFAVLVTYQKRNPIGDRLSEVDVARIDTSGVTTGWQAVHSLSTTDVAPGYDTALSAGFDGTNVYVALVTERLQSPAMTYRYQVFELGVATAVLDLTPFQNLTTQFWYNPTLYGFGCRAGACLATYRAEQAATNSSVIIGQAPTNLASANAGPIVGTPSGFLQAGTSGSEFSPTGALLSGPTTMALAGQAAVYDGTATRVLKTNASGTSSATFADDASLVSGPAVEIPAWTSDTALASFGSQQSVVVHADASGVTARFMGSLPASVPTGCPMPSGTGGAGGTGATTVSVSASSVSASVTTGVSTVAASTTAGTGGAGGSGGEGGATVSSSATTNVASSAAAAVAAATTGASPAVTSAAVGPASSSGEGGSTDQGSGGATGAVTGSGCSVGAPPTDESSGPAFTGTLLAALLAVSRRRRAG